MKKIKEIFTDFPEVRQVIFSDSGDSIKCIADSGTILCTNFKELRRLLKESRKH